MLSRSLPPTAAVGLLALLAACGARSGGLPAGQGGAGSASESSATAATSAAGAGGPGGAGVCSPGEEVPCPYSGPPDTEGVGACRAGLATCAPDGSTFGPCAGEVLPSPEVCGDAVDDDCDADPAECALTTLWANPATTGGTAVVRDLLELPNGNLVLLGAFTQFLAWGGLTIAVGPQEQGFLALFGPDGQVLELRTLVAKNGMLKLGALAVDASGHVYVSGGFSGSLAYAGLSLDAPAQQDAFLLSLTEDLDTRWARLFTGPSVDMAWAVAAGGDTVYVGGQFETSIDLGHGPTGGPPGDTDMFLVRLDAEGANLWEKTYGQPKPQTLEVLGLLSGGDLLIAATADGSADFGLGPLLLPDGAAHGVTARLTPLASPLGVDLFAGQGGSYPRQIAPGPDDVFALGGRTHGPLAWGGVDVCPGLDASAAASFVVLTANGSPQAVHCGADVLDVAIRPSGDALILGGFSGDLPLGGLTLSADGPMDFFLTSFTAAGTYPAAGRAGDGAWNAVDGRVVASGTDDAVVALSYLGDFDLFGAPLPSGSNETSGLVLARVRVP
jgi:hypothetical protein